MAKKFSLILVTTMILAACQSTPEIEEEEVNIDINPVVTCTPIDMLEKVDVPAETKMVTTIVLIDNPPYDPIERREEQERVVREAYTMYVDAEGQPVSDICELQESSEETVDDTDMTGNTDTEG